MNVLVRTTLMMNLRRVLGVDAGVRVEPHQLTLGDLIAARNTVLVGLPSCETRGGVPGQLVVTEGCLDKLRELLAG